MGKTTFSDCGQFDGDKFFTVLDGRLGDSTKMAVAAAFAATLGRGGIAYVARRTGLPMAALRDAASRLLADGSQRGLAEPRLRRGVIV